MKKLICVVLMLVMILCFTPLTMAQNQIGFGGLWVAGAHSDSGDYAMENEGKDGWGIFAHYDNDADWTLIMKKNWEIGVDPGMSYHYIQWTKNHNKEEERCEFEKYREYDNVECQGYGCSTARWQENENVNSQIIAATLKPYLQIKDDFRLFTVGGAGMEIADDGEDNFAVYGGVGAQYFFTKNLGLSVQYHEIYSNPTDDYRRWNLVVGAVEYRW
jgi:hypothetical protein